MEDLVLGDNDLYYTKNDMELADGNVCGLGDAELQDGKRDGTWKAWYKNDENKKWYEQADMQLMRIHNYENGQRHGEFKHWDSSGKLLKQAVFQNGKCLSGDCDYSWTEWGE